MNIEEKRKKILDYLEKKAKKEVLDNFQRFVGPGLKRKILRIIFSPSLYFPIVFKIKIPSLFGLTDVNANFFGFRSLKLPFSDAGSRYITAFNFIPDLGEIKLTKFLIKTFRETDIFYDIGANYGYYTYLALEFCQEVHSFKPLPDIFEYLKLNLKNEPKAFLNSVALSDKNGITTITLSKLGTGSSTIVKEVIEKNKNKFTNKTIEVPTITLDEYIKTHKPPTIIKIDVEGAESLVIEGGKEFLRNNNPIIAMEVWKGENFKIAQKAVSKLLELNYKPYQIDFDGNIKLIENISDIEKQGDSNYIFKK